MKAILTTLAFCLFISSALRGQGTLQGTVQDTKTEEVLEAVTVTIKSVGNTSIFLGARTDQDGKFMIKDIPYGDYLLKATSVGYKAYETKMNIKKGIGYATSIMMKKSGTALKAVQVLGKKSVIDVQADKKVFNVSSNLTSAGGMLEDVLQNVPGVSVDAESNVSLRGKSDVTLLIDGKRSAVFGDVATALQSIPAESIESIEVITNPSSKYEASGTGGIINIVMKGLSRKKGLTGSVSVGARYWFRSNANVRLNYQHNEHWGVFINTSGRYGKDWERNTVDRSEYDSDETFSSYANKLRNPLRTSVNFGTTYRPNDKISWTWTNSIFKGNFKGDENTFLYEQLNFDQTLTRSHRSNVYTARPSSYNTNLKFQKKFDRPKEVLNIEGTVGRRTYTRESVSETYVYDSLSQLQSYFFQENPVDGGNYTGTAQIDYEYPIGKEGKFEIGERSYFRLFQSENAPIISQNGQEYTTETRLINDYSFNEQLHGAYATISSKYKDYSFQAGLRGEYFKYDGDVVQMDTSFQIDYLSLFPSAFISKQLDKESSLTLNYTRRVKRPSFFQLLPFINVRNPLDTITGNPNLRPQFIHAFEVSYNTVYNKENNFLVGLYYQFTKDLIQRLRRFNDDGTTFSQNRNLASGTTYGIEITNRTVIKKGWDVSLNINAFRNIINGSLAESEEEFSGYGGFAKLINNTALGREMNLQISANYFAPKVITQGRTNAIAFMDFALKKSFMDRRLNLTLVASDIFNTRKRTTVFDLFPFQTQEYYYNRQTRFVGFNLQYKFPAKGNEGKGRYQEKKKTKARDSNFNDGDGGGGD